MAHIVASKNNIPALLGNPHFEMTRFLMERIGSHEYKSPRANGNQQLVINQTLVDEFAELQQPSERFSSGLLDNAPTIKDSNQATPDVIESVPTVEGTISRPSEYEVLRTNSIAKKNHAIQTKLEKVISYTKQTMVAYMK